MLERSVSCSSTAGDAAMDSFAAADVGVYFESGGDTAMELARTDVESYLSRLWSAPIQVATSAPDASDARKRATVWLSTSDAARGAAGVTISDGYAIRRVDSPSGPMIVVYAHDASNLVFGAYALLEELGIRFFHPLQELVPTHSKPLFPKALDIARAPAMRSRGIQLHTLHPIEYMGTFNVPSADHLAEAKHLIDWLVKTGQNHVQWALLGASVDFDAWRPHAQAIVDYAHSRGVTVGAVVQMWAGSALQGNYVLVKDTKQWQPQMEASLDRLMQIDWDVVDLALGEFVSTSPQDVIDWLSHATAYLATTHPKVETNIQNHVGNYPQLYVQYQGQTVFFYHLPQYADPRLGQNVHTLFFFDVYRNWATYAHPDFHLQHDYLFKELAAGRGVKYFPESAYWISADIDVPLFLPEYLYARWNDIHGLVSEARAQGLPPIDGHLMFSSGHEWNYWLTDYLSAKMLWEPDLPLDAFVARYAGAFGDCAKDVGTAVSSLVAIQSKYLFDQRLVAYVQGENGTVDEGYLAGLETHPKRVQFQEVLAMNDADRATFRATVVDPLDAMANEMKPIEDAIAVRCRGADGAIAPWCGELWDGVAIVRNRAQHAVHLYRSVLARAAGGDPEQDYRAALSLSDEARAIVLRREKAYRFDVDRLTADYANPTTYGFGYLRPAHTLCYWVRREQQLRILLDTGAPAGIIEIPTCTE